MIGLIFLLILTPFSAPAAAAVKVCGRVFSDLPISPKLDPLETRLVCGEEREGWESIPFTQARFHLKTFLQNRGYHKAVIEFDREKMTIKLGEPTKISALEAKGHPPELDTTRRRKIVGAQLTPEKLNELEVWVRSRLRQEGYACPELQTRANSLTGQVFVDVKAGAKQQIAGVQEEPSLLKTGILRRYDAFQKGDVFDERELSITERRILFEGLVQAVSFDTVCRNDGVYITQKVVPGLPRTFMFGFGFNTEDYFVVRTGWKHSRLFDMASLVDVQATASLRSQELASKMKWYVLPFASRFYLEPEVTIRRENEPKYETVSVKGRMRPTQELDFDDWFFKAGVGPSLEQTQLLRGVGPAFSRLLILESEVVLVGHDFEYYQAEPQSGVRIGIKAGTILSHNEAKVNAHQLEANGEWLYNFKSFEPPLLVLGGRYGFSTTVSDSVDQVVYELPTHFRYFLGGLSNLRGFGRQELPFHGTGALTAGFLGLEARATAILPQNFQPYIFVDLGAIGGRAWSFEPDVYWSPGLGLRWNSPIGVFRFNAAYGFVANRQPATPESLSHFQGYIAYGEEF